MNNTKKPSPGLHWYVDTDKKPPLGWGCQVGVSNADGDQVVQFIGTGEGSSKALLEHGYFVPLESPSKDFKAVYVDRWGRIS